MNTAPSRTRACCKWRWRGCANSPRTRWATRWACSTTSPGARTDARASWTTRRPRHPGWQGRRGPFASLRGGIGEWDKRTILYGYQDFPAGADEKVGLAPSSKKTSPVVCTTSPTRTPARRAARTRWPTSGTAVASATDELNRLVKVRAAALSRFGENNIAPGAPMATLENVLVPLYLMHRYQAEAAVKLIGGVNYAYAERGDGQPTNEPLSTEDPARRPGRRGADVAARVPDAARQGHRRHPTAAAGLRARPRTLRSAHGSGLRPAGGGGKLGQRGAGPPVQLAAPFAHRRAERARQKRADFAGGVRRGAKDRAEIDDRQSPYEQELARMVERQGLEHLFRVAASAEAQQQVCAEALRRIYDLQGEVTRRASADPHQQAQRDYVLFHIESFLHNPREYVAPKPARIPDGSPIGCGAGEFLGAFNN